jgi:FdhD protein
MPAGANSNMSANLPVLPTDVDREPVRSLRVRELCPGAAQERDDAVAVEEPLEIRVGSRSVSVTMRTPGHDAELAVGFLFTEGIIPGRDAVAAVHLCKSGNAVRVELRAGSSVDLGRLDRHFYTASSCGVCGKTSVAAVRVQPTHRTRPGWPVVEADVICRLPAALRADQTTFNRTGGLHAAALFDSCGRLLSLREDVGRHNALDKLIGAEALAGRTPLSDTVLLVSGRASFELVQKAAVAGIPILAAVGAPSSLAVDLALEHGLTLIGFVRDERCNVYSRPERIRAAVGTGF